MKIVFLASGAFALPTLRWLLAGDHEIVAVVTQPARARGRGRRQARTPVGAVAADAGLTVHAFEDVNAPESLDMLGSLEADLGLVIAFGQKLGPDLLNLPRGGCVNLHASLLPKYRGAAPINWAIINGEEKTGVTVFRIDAGMDTGPILTTRWTMIKPEETAEELHDRLAGIGVDAVDAALAQFADGQVPAGTPQDSEHATRAPKLTKTQGVVRFDRPARVVANHICGMWSWPAATARFEAGDGRWENVHLARARPAETTDPPADPPGTIDTRRYVACADAYLEILEIKPASGKRMNWPEYVNGRHVQAGDAFVTPKPEKRG